MITDSTDLLKIDAGLSQLFRLGYIRSDQTVPIIITAGPGRLQSVVSVVEGSNGRVRHVLEPLNAVAAWLPLAAVKEIVHLSFITDLELDQDLHIA